MFLLNAGYRWGAADGNNVEGAVFRASGQNIEDALRRDRRPLRRVLFDPQLYFLSYDLDVDDYPSLLAKLVTYPWFGANPGTYHSGDQSRREWSRDVRENLPAVWAERAPAFSNWTELVMSCVAFQVQFGANTVILPSAAITDPEDNLSEWCSRLDEAVSIAGRITDLPLLATAAFDHGTLAHREAYSNTLIDAVADAVSARDELSGTYALIVGETAARARIGNPRVAAGILRLTRMLAETGHPVSVNFVECLGLACLGLGAKEYATGYETKARRMVITDHRDGFGVAYPKFHSAALAMDFNPEPDLERLRDARLLRRLAADRTDASAELLDALARGRSAQDVVRWASRRNNVGAASEHYVQLHARLGAEAWTPDRVLEWLQDAEQAWLQMVERFSGNPLEAADGAHLASWGSAVEAVLG